jgi:tripartite-type tricarboxylate transporter receptor subunit TctC
MRRLPAVALLLALAPLIGLTASAAAQDLCAERTIRFIVPFPPGGSVDTVARLFAPHVGQATGRQIVVDNRGGASGSVGTAAAAAAPGDGCTVLLVFDTHAVNPSLIARLPFDTERDLAPVMLLGTSPMVLAAHPSTGITNWNQVLERARARPGDITYATIGQGSLAHLTMTQIANLAGIQLTHVPYRGGGPAVQDAVAGHVNMILATPFVLVSHIRDGRLRAIALTGAEPSAQLPEAPTFRALGFPGFEAYAWWGILMPGRTPPAMVARMHAEFTRVVAMPEVRARLDALGMDVIASDPDGLRRFVAAEIPRWREVVRANGITAGD